ncbi:hypothetical protein KBZ10_03685 [Streptomyces sp. F63]|uniref:hypothetical protein n=1 Tax=Streptomyces sp. F63 TaxID=2824887 RepID=UPI001B359919|nr:hypothetical protein [Streptomyces sp. F63]MBQ0983639.1 hypothetical protein [Streptomyces sp. F63]
MRTNEEVVEYLEEIVEVMIEGCGVSRAEAVARINQQWRGQDLDESPELIEHELPEFWAYRICYGTVPYWDPDVDRSQWKLREPPPADSPCWTVAS